MIKSQYPADIQIIECQTLDWYSVLSNSSFMSNTKMLLEEGEHELKNTIAIDNCHNFFHYDWKWECREPQWWLTAAN